MKTNAAIACATLGAIIGATGSAYATDLELDPPLVYVSNGTVEYNAATDQFVVLGDPTHVQFTNGGPMRPIMPTNAEQEKFFSIEIFVGPTGGLDGGAPADDLLLVGEVDEDGDGEKDYGQTLLKGEAFDFVFRDGPAGGPGEVETDFYHFRFYTTGGTMNDLYHGEVGVIVTSDDSNFEDFVNDFNGLAEAILGSSAQLGACCFGDGSCDDDLSRTECVNAGGLFQGVDTYCGDDPEDGGIECEPFGACCYPNGLCLDDITDVECEDSGGTYQGNMTFCSDTDCRGACCFNDGEGGEESGDVYCEDGLTENQCEDDGGIFQGHDVLCEDVVCPFGACCFDNGECINDVTEEYCEAEGGDYQDDGIGCDMVICGRGACCWNDGGNGSCTDDLTRVECEVQGGDYQGDGTLCDDVDCGIGACCFEDWDEECVDNLTRDDCEEDGGEYQGDGTRCEDVNCEPPPPYGACCLRDGHCLPHVPEIVCHVLLGEYQGDGTRCEDVICEPVTGACCLDDGGCLDLNFLCCVVIGGDYQGDDTLCDESMCVDAIFAEEDTSLGVSNEAIFGACCLPDEPVNGLDCVRMPEGCCDLVGGDFRGVGTHCDEVECGPQAPSRRDDGRSVFGSDRLLPSAR